MRRLGTSDVQSILLPKADYPTKASAERWLVAHGFRARQIEDSGKVRAGKFWRARQYDPTPGHTEKMKKFGESGIMAVVEITPKKVHRHSSKRRR